MISQRASCTPPLGPRPSPCAVPAARRGGAARRWSASASGASWTPATSAASGTTSRSWRTSTRAGSCGYTSAARGWAMRPGGRSVISSATPPFPQCKVENFEPSHGNIITLWMRKIFSMIGQAGHVSRGLAAPLRRPQQDIRHGVEVPAAARPAGGRRGLARPRQQADRQGGRGREPVAGGERPRLPRDAGPPHARHRDPGRHVGGQARHRAQGAAPGGHGAAPGQCKLHPHTGHTSSHSSVQGSARGWRKGQDQTLLTKFVWPEVKEVSCVHDSYLCTVYRCPHLASVSTSGPLSRSDHWLPYPTRRLPGVPYNFIGAAGPMVLNRCSVDS